MQKLVRGLCGLTVFFTMPFAQAQSNLSPPWSVDFGFGTPFGMAETRSQVFTTPGTIVAFQSNALVQQSTGLIVHAELNLDEHGFLLHRYGVNGSIDDTFAVGAANRFALGGKLGVDSVDVVRDSSDRLYVVLGRAADIVLCGLTSDGQLRADFGTARRGVLPMGCMSVPHDANPAYKDSFKVQVDANGNILVAGNDGAGRIFVERMDGTGARDLRFGTDGAVRLSANIRVRDPSRHELTGTYFEDLTAAADGSIYIAGRAGVERIGVAASYLTSHVTKLDRQGRVDASFGAAGQVMFASAALCELTLERCVTQFVPSPLQLQVDAANRLLLAGTVSGTCGTRNYCLLLAVARLAEGGALDTSFGTNGVSNLNAQLPAIWTAMPLSGDVVRATFEGPYPLQLLASRQKGEYATLTTLMDTYLLGKEVTPAMQQRYQEGPDNTKHLILPIDSLGLLRADADPLVDFGKGPPSNCRAAAVGPVIYGSEPDSLYIYTGGVDCYPSISEPIGGAKTFVSRIWHR